ncbi:MAG: hypothetical protein ABGY41_17710, partial [Candidatus Poribacteria bacterium]
MARRRTRSEARTGVLVLALVAWAAGYGGRANAATPLELDIVPADAAGVVWIRDVQGLRDNVDAFTAAVLPAQMDGSDALLRMLAP